MPRYKPIAPFVMAVLLILSAIGYFVIFSGYGKVSSKTIYVNGEVLICSIGKEDGYVYIEILEKRGLLEGNGYHIKSVLPLEESLIKTLNMDNVEIELVQDASNIGFNVDGQIYIYEPDERAIYFMQAGIRKKLIGASRIKG